MSKNEELIRKIVEQVVSAKSEQLISGGEEHVSCKGCGHCVTDRPAAVENIALAGASRVSAGLGIARPSVIPTLIDHTLLKPNAVAHEIEQLCGEALEYGFYSVCVNPTHVARCRAILEGSRVKVCTVIGFPLGANMTAVKAYEAKSAESLGADEIDMVINIGALKDNELSFVREDIAAVVEATSKEILTKVILENAYLTTEEKIKGCLMAKDAGADFVKTSTGFGPSGASAEDVALMRHAVGSEMGVKAAGGIRDTAMALKMMQAGATRIGASASVKIVTGTV